MPLIATRGAASAQGFGEFAQTAAPVYIEDVFSTYLYTGNGSTQTITNGIDLSGKGGFVWTKNRDTGGTNHILCDTARGITNYINSNNTNGQNANGVLTDVLTGTTTSGYTLGADATLQAVNVSTKTYVSWTFRKQPKFFDVVTYTGNGSSTNNVSHNLGSLPGFIVVKRTDTSGNWCVAAGDSSGNYLQLSLNSTSQSFASAAKSAIATTTTFNAGYIGTNFDGSANVNGGTYVAYLFAHNAGGFGLTGSDNVITCGSYTTDGSGNATVSLGYEPQWLLTKLSSTTGDWRIIDIMRGMSLTNNFFLYPNTSGAEVDNTFATWRPTATGFTHNQANANQTFIYIAIRRGPMKTPTTGTSVFTPTAFSGNDTSGTRSAGLDAFDLLISKRTASSSLDWVWLDKLRGLAGNRWLSSDSTDYETASGGTLDTINTINGQYTQNGINITKTSNYSYLDAGGSNYVWYALKRAPGFFDEVCYTGAGGATQTMTHSLGVVPQMIFMKKRSGSSRWPVYHIGVPSPLTNNPDLNGTAAYFGNAYIPSTPTSTQFTVAAFNDSSATYIAYLFATCAGVSKVGSYTGTGALQTVDCGFTSGARFILIKRVDSSGDWYTYDSAQGISSGNDPYLFMNSTAVQATGTNYVDTTSVGFQVTAAAPAGLNANGGTYIFLAIA